MLTGLWTNVYNIIKSKESISSKDTDVNVTANEMMTEHSDH